MKPGKHEEEFWKKYPEFSIKKPYIKNKYSDYLIYKKLNYKFEWQSIEISIEEIEKICKMKDVSHIEISVAASEDFSVEIESANVVLYNINKFEKYKKEQLVINQISEEWEKAYCEYNKAVNQDILETKKQNEYELYLKLKEKYEKNQE